MRQWLSQKKINRLRCVTGLSIRSVSVRGGTDHRKDLYLENGAIVHMYKDGTFGDQTPRRAIVQSATDGKGE